MKPDMPRIASLVRSIATATSMAGGMALATLALVCAWQVFARYVLNSSPGWTEPVALLLLNTVMMLGAAVAVHSASHFGFFIAVESAPARLRAFLQALGHLLIALSGAALCYWGCVLAIDSWPIAMAGAPLSQGLAYAPLSIGGALMTLFAGARLLLPGDRQAGA
jgi:TRAP-type C4-dicarboxylate transport system permease small subunit